MEKTKNNKVYLYAYTISFIIILLFLSIFIYKKNEADELKTKKEIATVNNLLNSGKYDSAIKNIEDKGSGSLTRHNKLKLLSSYLNYGNYFNKEEEFSRKAIEILDTMEDDYSKFYYYGYAKEIIKDYTGALDNYNKGLQIIGLSNEQKSLFQNQIGHVYDLKGEFEKVFSYYNEAYKLDENNSSALSNLGRYYARTKEFEKAYELLNKALKIATNDPSKAEISFSLSSIELELNGLEPNIDKSIEYAKKSIEYYPEYAMGYTALARGLYMKNDINNHTDIEENLNKAIELNPNSYYAYELYALHEYDKGNFEKSLEFFKKSDSAIDKDMILMDNVRQSEKLAINFKYYILFEIKKFKEDKMKLYDFLEKMLVTDLGKSIIKLQVKREGYGILGIVDSDKKYKELISKLNK